MSTTTDTRGTIELDGGHRLEAARYEHRAPDGTLYALARHEGTAEWSVYRYGTGEILSAEGTWDRSTGDRESQAAWRASHRFTLDEAIGRLAAILA